MKSEDTLSNLAPFFLQLDERWYRLVIAKRFIREDLKTATCWCRYKGIEIAAMILILHSR